MIRTCRRGIAEQAIEILDSLLRIHNDLMNLPHRRLAVGPDLGACPPDPLPYPGLPELFHLHRVIGGKLLLGHYTNLRPGIR